MILTKFMTIYPYILTSTVELSAFYSYFFLGSTWSDMVQRLCMLLKRYRLLLYFTFSFISSRLLIHFHEV